MDRRQRRRLCSLALSGLLISTPVVTTGCDSGCDTTLTATAGTAHRTGSGPVTAEISVDVSAKLTSGGKGVGGVLIAFDAVMPNGTAEDVASAVTDADGVAHYSGPAGFGVANALASVTTAQTIKYYARTMVVGSKPDRGVCDLLTTRSQPVDLRYQS